MNKTKSFKMTALAFAAAQVALMHSGGALAQTDAAAPAAKDGEEITTVVVTGQRKQLETAAQLKRDAEQIVDSVVADEAGKLPDKSITEVLQRVVGVTMDRNTSRTRTNAASNPLSFNVEGSGVQIRGLSWGSSTLNGRESFSAGWPGRELSWGDIPPELMAGVDVYKNPSAELIEGGISGQVNLRTRLPFDSKGESGALTFADNYTPFGKKNSPAFSALYSNRWSTDMGQFGALVDISYGKSAFRSDGYSMGTFYPLTKPQPGQTVWVPTGTSWSTSEGESERAGIYGALQWKKNGKESSLTYFDSGFRSANTNANINIGADDTNLGLSPYNLMVANGQYDANGVLQKGHLTYPGGIGSNRFATGGLSVGTQNGFDNAGGRTRELAWNAKWNMNESWTFQSDLQWVHSTNHGDGGMIGMGSFVPSMDVDMTTQPRPTVSFDDAARAALADPGNYYYNFIQPYKTKASGDLYAWKGDVKYSFDNPVLRDVRFGVRLTKRAASHLIAVGNTWTSIAEPWAVQQSSTPGQQPSQADFNSWQSRGSFGYLSDPRYAAIGSVQTFQFPNFFNGRMAAPPAIVTATSAMVRDYPDQYQSLMAVLRMQCQDSNTLRNTNNDCTTQGTSWKALRFTNDPKETDPQNPLQGAASTHSETTQALYGTLRFGFDRLRFPVEGNAGVRVVRSNTKANGYTVFNPTYGANTDPSVPRFGQITEPLNVEGSHVDVTPSLNLKVMLTDKLQSRLALSQGIYRPGFDQLQEYIQLEQKVETTNGKTTAVIYSGKNSGNANLKPLKANNIDLSLEWYPRNGQMLSAVLFYKTVKDIIMTDTYDRTVNDLAGNPQVFHITGPANAAKLWTGGLELSGSTYLDKIPGLEGKLPDWAKGFGVTANWTYLDGKQELYHPYTLPYCPAAASSAGPLQNLYGCDLNGLPFKDLPVPYMSKRAFNLALMYDRGPLSMRLAYSWRSRTLQATNAFGASGNHATSADPVRIAANNGVAPTDVGWGLPVWQEAVGQWDGSVNYNFSDRLWANASVSNITQTVTKQSNQQFIGNMGRSWYDPGRSFRVSMGYHF